MSLTNYAELISAVERWIKRADLNSQIPDFISITENKLSRVLRTAQQQTQVIANAAFPIAIPGDLQDVIALSVLVGARYKSLEYLPGNKVNNSKGTAFGYSVLNNKFILEPASENAIDYKLDYYAKIPALSDVNPSNWLLTKYPGVYLYGSLVQASLYMVDDERVGIWKAQFEEEVNLINLDNNALAARGSLAVRAR